MVPLDRALVSSYRLSIVTMSLSRAVWPQFATQSFIQTRFSALVKEKLVAFKGKDNLTLCGVVLLRWELREGIGKGWLLGLNRYKHRKKIIHGDSDWICAHFQRDPQSRIL